MDLLESGKQSHGCSGLLWVAMDAGCYLWRITYINMHCEIAKTAKYTKTDEGMEKGGSMFLP